MRFTTRGLKKMFDYDGETGCFFSRKTGERVETFTDELGAQRIKCGMYSYPAHYIAYAIAKQTKPDLVFCYDENPANLKIDNLYKMSLREAFEDGLCYLPDYWDIYPQSSTWLCPKVGAYRDRIKDIWQSYAVFLYNKHIIGYYNSQEEAHEAFIEFVEEYSV